jgi:hypothetical protein
VLRLVFTIALGVGVAAIVPARLVHRPRRRAPDDDARATGAPPAAG